MFLLFSRIWIYGLESEIMKKKKEQITVECQLSKLIGDWGVH